MAEAEEFRIADVAELLRIDQTSLRNLGRRKVITANQAGEAGWENLSKFMLDPAAAARIVQYLWFREIPVKEGKARVVVDDKGNKCLINALGIPSSGMAILMDKRVAFDYPELPMTVDLEVLASALQDSNNSMPFPSQGIMLNNWFGLFRHTPEHLKLNVRRLNGASLAKQVCSELRELGPVEFVGLGTPIDKPLRYSIPDKDQAERINTALEKLAEAVGRREYLKYGNTRTASFAFQKIVDNIYRLCGDTSPEASSLKAFINAGFKRESKAQSGFTKKARRLTVTSLPPQLDEFERAWNQEATNDFLDSNNFNDIEMLDNVIDARSGELFYWLDPHLTEYSSATHLRFNNGQAAMLNKATAVQHAVTSRLVSSFLDVPTLNNTEYNGSVWDYFGGGSLDLVLTTIGRLEINYLDADAIEDIESKAIIANPGHYR